MKLKNKPVYSFWYDLVFHVLAHIPVGSSEAGKLYEPGYVDWWKRRFSGEANQKRTVNTDARLLADMYNNTQQAFLLNHFIHLFQDIDQFNAGMDKMFTELTFSHPRQKRVSELIIRHIPGQLLELFRIAIWSEAQAGYGEMHGQYVMPIYNNRIPELEKELAALAEIVTGLEESRFIVSHPLRRAGRLLAGQPEARIAIGIADDDFDVPAWLPAMQGCHEYILGKCIDTVGNRSPHNPRAGSRGYYDHLAPEFIALSIEALLFKKQHRDHFRQWLKGNLPENCTQLADALPWDIPVVPQTKGIDTLALWLASGDVVPDRMKRDFYAVAEFFSLNP